MRILTLACAHALATGARAAQERDTTRRGAGTPREVQREVADVYNRPSTLRLSGRQEIGAGQEIAGDVAILGGNLTLGGHIAGRLVVVNGDVTFLRGSRVDGEAIIVGGAAEGADNAAIAGGLRVFPDVMYYREVNGELVVDTREPEEVDSWIRRWLNRHRRSTSGLRLTKVGSYNRVEGLPIGLGPMVRLEPPWGRVSLRALGIYRLRDDVDWSGENVGHDVSGDVRFGKRRGVAVGGRLYDVVDPVEPWQMTDIEVALGTFLLHRDFRDYFGRHGGSLHASLFSGDAAELTLSYGNERWIARRTHNPFTLFRNGQSWRPNPAMDEGKVHLANATLRLDTRNDPEDPQVGWLVVADLEHGRGRYSSLGVTDLTARNPLTVPPLATYSRVFLDLRRYNRLSPAAQLNVRLVAGGWLGGDELPLERRLSVGGPGSLPGFDFRRTEGDPEVGMCTSSNAPPGVTLVPQAECERMVLAQVEYRSEVDLNVFDWFSRRRATPEPQRSFSGFSVGGEWVLFADAGRGWLVGPRDDRGLQYPSRSFPGLNTFRADVGAGLDFGILGVYVAKAVSKSSEPFNFFLRLRHRF
jgi:hypothetical protein